ncbi:hypothetical protein BDW59DRAFT_137627 [Aspergillus cavernicola]|uniref:Uncharacterized protein n=1 Tax=Aspergillus cavernicola TaxID=176166 RepID=A0ABR4J2L6_9EURO
MDIRLSVNYFDSPACRLSYLASRTSGEAQNQLLTRLRSTVLESITDITGAFAYLELLYDDPELEITDPKDFLSPDEGRDGFWKYFSDFIWNAVKYRFSKEQWSQKLHEYMQLKYGSDIGDYASFPERFPKKLAKEIYLRLLRQRFEDNDYPGHPCD